MASEQKCQSGVDALHFHEIADCNKLFSHSQKCDLGLVWSRSLSCFSPYKFLWVRLGCCRWNFTPSLRLLVPQPRPHGALLQAFRIHLPSWGYSLTELWSVRSPWNPTSLSSVQEGPKSPGEFPILLTLPSSLPPPLGRSLERQLVEGPETGTFGGATPGDPFLPITNPIRRQDVRAAQCPPFACSSDE